MTTPEPDADTTPRSAEGRGLRWLDTASPWVSAAAGALFGLNFVIHLVEFVRGPERNGFEVVLLVAYGAFAVYWSVRAVQRFRRRRER